MGCFHLSCHLLCRAGRRTLLLHGEGFLPRDWDVSKPKVQPMGWRRWSTPGRMGKKEGCSNIKKMLVVEGEAKEINELLLANGRL